MKKSRKLLLFFAVALLLGYLLFPLKSNELIIPERADLLEGKNAYLAQKLETDSSFRPPNIVLILADDLGKMDLSSTGNKLIQTPVMDSFGINGLTCDQAYVTASLCSPSRAGLITGRYQQRFGYEHQIHERYPKNRLEFLAFKYFIDCAPWVPQNPKAIPITEEQEKQGLPPYEITIAELLKKRDYKTAVIGKWHMGSHEQNRPYNRGFDRHFGFYNAFSLFAYESDSTVIHQKIPADFTDSHIWAGQRDGNCAIVDNEKIVEEPGYLTERFTEEAIKFIRKEKDHPFFLFLPYSTPHTPLQITKDYYDDLGGIKDPIKRTYNGMIASLDDAIGEVLVEIENQGLSEETLIIFLSDNGGASYAYVTDNKPRKGGKLTLFNGGLEVPCMLQWKGKIRPGARIDAPVSALDVFATIADAAQIPLPKDRIMDGISLLPFGKSKNAKLVDRPLFWRGGASKAILEDGWKLMVDTERDKKCLYNLKEDRNETRDLSLKNPEKVNLLTEKLKAWEATVMPPSWPSVMWYKYEDDQGEYYFEI